MKYAITMHRWNDHDPRPEYLTHVDDRTIRKFDTEDEAREYARNCRQKAKKRHRARACRYKVCPAPRRKTKLY